MYMSQLGDIRDIKRGGIIYLTIYLIPYLIEDEKNKWWDNLTYPITNIHGIWCIISSFIIFNKTWPKGKDKLSLYIKVYDA